MPVLIDSMMDALDEGQQKRAKEFWDNAYAYAMQSVPYAQERLDALNQAGSEVAQQLMTLPEDQQQKLHEQLTNDLIKPIEGFTAQEYDAAWKKLQGITQALHKRFTPSLSPMNPMAPQGMTQPGPTNPPMESYYWRSATITTITVSTKHPSKA